MCSKYCVYAKYTSRDYSHALNRVAFLTIVTTLNNILAVLDDMELKLIPTQSLIKLTMTMNWTTMNTGPSYKSSYTPKDLYSSPNDF